MLTDGAGWNNTWNGENRLIETYNDTVGKKLEFDYDYMGRRVEKKVYTGTSGTSWTLSTHERFAYDGYKCIEVLDGANSNAILQKFLWNGEEILSVYDVAATATYYYFADANKNIGQLMDSSGNTVAKYEYSPFGVQTSATGAYAATNQFRFSSEYYDSETGLVYYNYRYYSPTLGRWLSRDPIMEAGGWNLYNGMGNNPICYIDSNGRFWGGMAGLEGAGYGLSKMFEGTQIGAGMGIGGKIRSPLGSVNLNATELYGYELKSGGLNYYDRSKASIRAETFFKLGGGYDSKEGFSGSWGDYSASSFDDIGVGFDATAPYQTSGMAVSIGVNWHLSNTAKLLWNETRKLFR